MPYKKGGGWYQLYDPDNGQYTEEEKSRLLEKDRKNLEFYLKTRMIEPGNEPPFPIASLHDKKYCQDFVIAYREQFNHPSIAEQKAKWLFELHNGHDRSKFLLKIIGYSFYEQGLFISHIIKKTDFKTIKFSRIDKNKYFKCKALTILKNGMLVTSIWDVNPENLQIKFDTFIPDRDTYDKD